MKDPVTQDISLLYRARWNGLGGQGAPTGSAVTIRCIPMANGIVPVVFTLFPLETLHS